MIITLKDEIHGKEAYANRLDKDFGNYFGPDNP